MVGRYCPKCFHRVETETTYCKNCGCDLAKWTLKKYSTWKIEDEHKMVDDMLASGSYKTYWFKCIIIATIISIIGGIITYADEKMLLLPFLMLLCTPIVRTIVRHQVRPYCYEYLSIFCNTDSASKFRSSRLATYISVFGDDIFQNMLELGGKKYRALLEAENKCCVDANNENEKVKEREREETKNRKKEYDEMFLTAWKANTREEREVLLEEAKKFKEEWGL